MQTCEHTRACTWILKVWFQLSGKMPGNSPGLAPLFFFFVGIWHTVLRVPLFSRLPLLCFTSPPHPHFSALFFPSVSTPFFALILRLIPGQFKRRHPGSPTEQGCSVHIHYPVAGCHPKVLADTSQAQPSDRNRQRLNEPIAAQELQVSPRQATHRNYKILKPFVFTAGTVPVQREQNTSPKIPE